MKVQDFNAPKVNSDLVELILFENPDDDEGQLINWYDREVIGISNEKENS